MLTFLGCAWFLIAFAMETRTHKALALKCAMLVLFAAGMVIIDLANKGVFS